MMAGGFGLLVVYGLVDRVVYPVWIEPALSIDQRIEERRVRLTELEDLADRVDRGKRMYRDYAARLGSMDVGRVETDVRARLNTLIEKHQLQDMQVSRTKPTRVGKTDVLRMRVVVKAAGPLEAAVGFMRDVAELPHLLRVENVKMSPLRSRGRGKKQQRVSLTMPMEIRVLPQDRIFDSRLQDEDLAQPELFVRHADRDFGSIWDAKPFWAFVPPVPLRVQVGRPVNVQIGQRASITASASGGDGTYTFQWTPSEGLKTPGKATTEVGTADARTQNYIATVTDGTGKTATASVTVTVKAAPRVAERAPAGPLTVQAGPTVNVEEGKRASLTATAIGGDGVYKYVWSPKQRLRTPNRAMTDLDTSQAFTETFTISVTDGTGATATGTVLVSISKTRWKQRKYQQLRMALLQSAGEHRLDEVMVYNNKSKQAEYYAVGDDFDGGELIFVHPTGGLVRRMDGYFIYPIGGWLDKDIAVTPDAAAEHPWLASAAEGDKTRLAERAEANRAADEAAAKEAAEKEAEDAAKRPTAPKPKPVEKPKATKPGSAAKRPSPDTGAARKPAPRRGTAKPKAATGRSAKRREASPGSQLKLPAGQETKKSKGKSDKAPGK